ncbi:hypothetical protein ACFQ9U_29790 [Streptomyces sp. NPDC056568]|uniref:hypothetical protein n=1 Tax=Streptomyces sp. NPDC056568 TaxID=3345866 RepID=UPI00369465E3
MPVAREPGRTTPTGSPRVMAGGDVRPAAGIRQRLLFVHVVLPGAAVVTMDESAWR